jgi:hypothetical protein
VIEASVIKGIHELLGEHGAEPIPNEQFGDFVARALNITASQAEVLLEALHSGATVEEAMTKAEIGPANINRELLLIVARAIGAALGELKIHRSSL